MPSLVETTLFLLFIFPCPLATFCVVFRGGLFPSLRSIPKPSLKVDAIRRTDGPALLTQVKDGTTTTRCLGEPVAHGVGAHVVGLELHQVLVKLVVAHQGRQGRRVHPGRPHRPVALGPADLDGLDQPVVHQDVHELLDVGVAERRVVGDARGRDELGDLLDRRVLVVAGGQGQQLRALGLARGAGRRFRGGGGGVFGRHLLGAALFALGRGGGGVALQDALLGLLFPAGGDVDAAVGALLGDVVEDDLEQLLDEGLVQVGVCVPRAARRLVARPQAGLDVHLLVGVLDALHVLDEGLALEELKVGLEHAVVHAQAGLEGARPDAVGAGVVDHRVDHGLLAVQVAVLFGVGDGAVAPGVAAAGAAHGDEQLLVQEGLDEGEEGVDALGDAKGHELLLREEVALVAGRDALVVERFLHDGDFGRVRFGRHVRCGLS